MLTFDARNPYPLMDASRLAQTEILAHSHEVDLWLGLRVEEIEGELSLDGCRRRAPNASGEKQQLWFGLAAQSLLTPYVEIRDILMRLELEQGELVVDLGAAYGRMGCVIARHHAGVRFVGYEYVGERVEEGRRVFARGVDPRDRERIRLEHADLTSPGFTPVVADHYFIYDFGTDKAISKTLHDLRRLARVNPFKLIARGRRVRYAIESQHQQWLSRVDPGGAERRTTIYDSSASTSNLRCKTA